MLPSYVDVINSFLVSAYLSSFHLFFLFLLIKLPFITNADGFGGALEKVPFSVSAIFVTLFHYVHSFVFNFI